MEILELSLLQWMEWKILQLSPYRVKKCKKLWNQCIIIYFLWQRGIFLYPALKIYFPLFQLQVVWIQFMLGSPHPHPPLIAVVDLLESMTKQCFQGERHSIWPHKKASPSPSTSAKDGWALLLPMNTRPLRPYTGHTSFFFFFANAYKQASIEQYRDQQKRIFPK